MSSEERSTGGTGEATIPGWRSVEFGRRLGLKTLGATAAVGGLAALTSASEASAATKSSTNSPNFIPLAQKGAPSGVAALDASEALFQVQPAETTPVIFAVLTPFTAGNEAFQIEENSFANSGGGAGTYNHAVHYGWNAGRHSGAPVVSGMPAFIFGIEDNYYDPATSQFTGEFYMEYWSPDGTTVQMFRPFYASIRGTTANALVSAAVLIAIGDSAILGEFAVQDRQGGTNYFYVNPTGAAFTVPLSLTVASGSNVFEVLAPAGDAGILLNSEYAPYIQFKQGSALGWLFQGFTNSFVISDQNARTQVTLTEGVSATTALTELSSSLKVNGNVGFYGTTPTTAQVSGGTTAGVIAGLVALGLFGS